MSETTSPAPVADAITPANILDPVSVPVPGTDKPATATPPAAAETPKEATADQAANENDEAKPKQKASERIGELYGKAKAAERLAAERAREVYDLRQQLAELQRSPADPSDFAAQQRNDVRTAVKEERLAQAERDAVAQAAEAQNLRLASFNAKVEAARERIPDMDTVLAEFANLPVSEYAAEIISESDKAAEISYFLAKNPAEARRIASLTPHKQAYELARIETRVSQAQPRKTSNAPPPVPMIGAASSPSAPTLQAASVSDIAKMLGYGG